eukprot:scaffold61057_cov15-Prasinocladus_malaysianus.AAC.3
MCFENERRVQGRANATNAPKGLNCVPLVKCCIRLLEASFYDRKIKAKDDDGCAMRDRPFSSAAVGRHERDIN